ncbi:heparinase II/III family protein [Rhodoblastus sp.]|uniref:heparinase II/III family protein n=1 Tax=Rhodoblastus sp. TaxID=1962975 RepID=UPI0025EA5922|nr:heparinase II/III family protein [Rhodoblastus sp.]
MTISRALPLAERLRLVRLTIARGALKLRAVAKWPFLAFEEWRCSPPERLLIAPQDIRTGDPTAAADIYAGYYAFCGKIVNAHGQSPFALPAPSAEWSRELNGFSWLRHLRAANTALARANARSLLKEFLALLGKPRAHPAWEPEVVARRTISWLSQSPMLLEGVDYPDYRRVLRVLTCGYWRLRRQCDSGLAGETRLTMAVAMTAYSLCVQGGASMLKRSVAVLNEQLNRQVLPDGGTISRNPQALLDLLFDLLPLRQAFAARGLSPPPDLLNAIDRMTPALRMFRHGDGSLALFNGMGVTAPDGIAIALAYEDNRNQPVFNARYSGYQRLEAQDALVILDAGRPPPPLSSRDAHAGCLSFEFSLGADKVVINCGDPGPSRPKLRASARLTAAHSTLVLDDSSSCLFSAQIGAARWFDDEILLGPERVPATREDNTRGSMVLASHDGYLRRLGFLHERRWLLQADGGRLQGKDRLIAANGSERSNVNYAIRFHIHPAATLTQIRDGAGVLLELPSGAKLAFEAGGLPLAIEESILFAAPEGSRACEQIVVYGASADIAEVDWSFTLQRANSPLEQV